jgi:hypothetical protein
VVDLAGLYVAAGPGDGDHHHQDLDGEHHHQLLDVVGRALLQIRERRLYREAHKTFEDYCQDRFGMSRRRANQLILATSDTENLGTPVPITERQARPLTRLDPEQQREVWKEALNTAPNGKVTAARGSAGAFSWTATPSTTRTSTRSRGTHPAGDHHQLLDRRPGRAAPGTPGAGLDDKDPPGCQPEAFP